MTSLRKYRYILVVETGKLSGIIAGAGNTVC
jgi:hypothetical protein